MSASQQLTGGGDQLDQALAAPGNNRDKGAPDNSITEGLMTKSDEDAGQQYEAMCAWFDKINTRCKTGQVTVTQEEPETIAAD
ncbi:hypothetical protein K466DRAFT_605176 [Polyporus arcularius HHB13444]|uniref:Uncharacterized protein n=1 Tax=Polyporus arcularius HHB13444 TaxID=1314778 RepID=A0A5C3P4D5_9APHY|nr:hypothetical protein K466DRAFT_605176 [Polyporus arcularius HHB13444]